MERSIYSYSTVCNFITVYNIHLMDILFQLRYLDTCDNTCDEDTWISGFYPKVSLINIPKQKKITNLIFLPK